MTVDDRETRVSRLTQQLLAERDQHKERKAPPGERRDLADACGFDPHQVTKWKVVAPVDGTPGYLPTTRMRRGSVGFFVACRACGTEFESKGMAYCAACLELPVEERRFMKPAATGRLCQAPGCEQFVPRTARAGARYCSKGCAERAYRARRERDNRAGLSDSAPPESERDSEEKT